MENICGLISIKGVMAFVYPKQYDVIVVGAGHAGVEAALAAEVEESVEEMEEKDSPDNRDILEQVGKVAMGVLRIVTIDHPLL